MSNFLQVNIEQKGKTAPQKDILSMLHPFKKINTPVFPYFLLKNFVL